MGKDTEKVNNEKEKNVKKSKKADKKPNIFVRGWRKIKEVFSELKKVTWPTFPTVLKQLGAVLVTVVIVLVLIMLIDLGLQQGLKLIRNDTASSVVEFLSEVL